MVKYLLIRNRKYLVRDELNALLIFYDFFLFRPTIKPRFLLRIINIVIRSLIKIVFSLRLNNLFRKISIEEDFIIRRKGIGIFPNCVNLIKKNNKYMIMKCFGSENLYKKEINFVDIYSKNNSSKIRLLKPIKAINYNTIYYEYIMSKNLSLFIKEGRYNTSTLFNLYEDLCKEIDTFYKNKEKTIIHGDLTPDNLYLLSNAFYIIDYSDSEEYYSKYDKYVLLRRLILDFYGNIRGEKLKKYFSENDIERFERHLLNKTREKIGK